MLAEFSIRENKIVNGDHVQQDITLSYVTRSSKIMLNVITIVILTHSIFCE